MFVHVVSFTPAGLKPVFHFYEVFNIHYQNTSHKLSFDKNIPNKTKIKHLTVCLCMLFSFPPAGLKALFHFFEVLPKYTLHGQLARTAQ